MKCLIVIASMLFGTLILRAQTTAEEYLEKLPQAPKNICSMTSSQKEAYLDWVENASYHLNNDISKRNEMSSAIMESRRSEMEAGSIQRAGFSEEEARELKKSNERGEDDNKELADQMLQRQLNMSMAEIDKLKNMSEEGRKAWAEAYSAEMMANTMANPGQQMQRSDSIGREMDMVSEQNYLRQKLQQDEGIYLNRFDSLEQASNEAYKKLLEEIKPLQEQLKGLGYGIGSAAGDERAENILMQIQTKQDAFCREFTPRYLEILLEYKAYILSAFPEIDRFEQLQVKVIESQSGLKTPLNLPAVLSCSKVTEYVELLKSSFKYKLYYPTEN